MEKSGVEPYSDEWMANNATNVPEALREAVRSICNGWYMDSQAPNLVSAMIERGLFSQIVRRVRLKNGEIVAPFEIVYKPGFWYYRADVLDGSGKIVTYESDDIDETVDPLDWVRDPEGNLISQASR